MSSTRINLIRGRGAFSRYAPTALSSSRLWQTQTSLAQVQRAAYAIPPHDKHQDDLGGPYGQESPNPEQRKRTNKSTAFQAAVIVGLGLGVVVVGGSFFSPRQIANYQIDNDTQIGGPNSNTAGSLAAVKRKEGVKTTHQLHQEMTGSSELGNK